MTGLAFHTSAFLRGVVAISAVAIAALATAGTPEPAGLFSTVPASKSSKLAFDKQTVLPSQAIPGKSRQVNVNIKQLEGNRIFVSLPGDITYEAVRQFKGQTGANQFSWVGHAREDKNNRVVIAVKGKAAAGTFSYNGKLYKLEPRRNGQHILAEVAPTDPAPELEPIPVGDPLASDPSSTFDLGLDDVVSAADAGDSVMDVMVAYTPAVQSIYGNDGVQALIMQAVAETNQAYANSNMNVRLNLVHTVMVNYTESSSMSLDLSRFRGNNDGYMEEIHALRDTYGADLVSLIANQPQYCGVAYRMTSMSSYFAASAFSVVHHGCATGYYSFGHEVGHNQGAHHDPDNGSGAIFDYAYGHQDSVNAFRTVMSYNCPGGCVRVNYFSNPNVNYQGAPTGIASYTNNALAISQTAPLVASFRSASATPTPPPPPAPPSDLTGTALSHDAIQLAWQDASNDETGFYVERSTNGFSFSQIATLGKNVTEYVDDSLQADSLYHYRVRSHNSSGFSSYSNVAAIATEPASSVVEQYAYDSIAWARITGGDMENTWADDSIAFSVQEVPILNKDGETISVMGVVWAFDVQPGSSITFYADASVSGSNGTFRFAYTTDAQSFVNMFNISRQNPGVHQFSLPPSISGRVLIVLQNNDWEPGANPGETVHIDHMVIKTVGATSNDDLPLRSLLSGDPAADKPSRDRSALLGGTRELRR